MKRRYLWFILAAEVILLSSAGIGLAVTMRAPTYVAAPGYSCNPPIDSKGADYCMQKDMRTIGVINLVVTLTGIVVSFAGIVVVYMTFRQTKDSIENEKKLGHAQVRAYLSIKLSSSDNLIVNDYSQPMSIINSGQSPATNVNYVAIITGMNGDIDDTNIFPFGVDKNIPSKGIYIGAGDNVSISAKLENCTPLAVQQSLRTGNGKIYLFARVYYDDVFGIAHEVTFAAKLADIIEVPDGFKVKRSFHWILARKFNDFKQVL